jgi:hypothetical protein
MSDTVVFHLKRMWQGKDLYEEIKSGRKTSEWRDCTTYWVRRLMRPLVEVGRLTRAGFSDSPAEDFTHRLRVHKAWLVIGFPKNSVPRFQVEIKGLFYHPSTCQLEIQFVNLREVVAKICGLPVVVDQNEPNWRLEPPGEHKP